jgi:DNA-binding PucR family transcriptional regulator
MGLKGDKLALAAGMLPVELRRLQEMDPIAKFTEQKAQADAEHEMAELVMVAARGGDAKAAMDILKHSHGWTAASTVQVNVDQRISITAALEQAEQRVMKVVPHNANPDLHGHRRTVIDVADVESDDQEHTLKLRYDVVPVGAEGDAS